MMLGMALTVAGVALVVRPPRDTEAKEVPP